MWLETGFPDRFLAVFLNPSAQIMAQYFKTDMASSFHINLTFMIISLHGAIAYNVCRWKAARGCSFPNLITNIYRIAFCETVHAHRATGGHCHQKSQHGGPANF
jgi:hypothetical protein